MKKIVTLIVMMAFMFSIGTIACGATSLENGISDKKAAMQQKREEIKAQIQERQEIKTQLQPLVDQIKANRSEILSLKAEVRTTQQAAVAHIKELKKNPEGVSEAQMTQLKAALQTLKESRVELAQSVGDIQIQRLEYKSARLQKNSEQMQQNLNSIMTVQQNRITAMKAIIEELKAIPSI